MKLLIATSNKGKIREFREMLGADRFQWSDLSEHREIEPVEETGQTFLDNACLKASYYARALNTWAMADRRRAIMRSSPRWCRSTRVPTCRSAKPGICLEFASKGIPICAGF